MKLFIQWRVSRFLIVFAVLLTSQIARSAGQTSKTVIPFLNLVAQAKTNYDSGRIVEARNQIKEFIQLNKTDALSKALKLNQDVADFCLSHGDLDYALQILENNVQIVENEFGTEHPETANALARIALFHLRQNSSDRALTALQQCLAVSEKAFGTNSLEVGRILEATATCHAELGQTTQAVASRERSLRILEKIFRDEDSHVLDSRSDLATLYVRQGNLAFALRLLQKSVDAQERALGSETLKIFTEDSSPSKPVTDNEQLRTNAILISISYVRLCQVQRLLGKYDEAMSLALRCRRMNERI